MISKYNTKSRNHLARRGAMMITSFAQGWAGKTAYPHWGVWNNTPKGWLLDGCGGRHGGIASVAE
jgi:hypothetical protein